MHAALSNGALRLVDSESTQFGGRPEVYYNNEWGTVCNERWGNADATVACRHVQVGFVGVCECMHVIVRVSNWVEHHSCGNLFSTKVSIIHIFM